jgi:hypothetical protein
MKFVVALDRRTERAAPHNVGSEVPVRQVGVVLVPACLELFNQACDCVNRFLHLGSFNTQGGAVGLMFAWHNGA